MKAVQIHHFSDVLCVWAYVAQARIEELCRVHGDEIELHYHYVDVFGDVLGRTVPRWCDKGGLEGYSKHVREVARGFDDVEVHPEVWLRSVPTSSLSCHEFLHAVRLNHGAESQARAAWALRLAFFKCAEDVSQRASQFQVAEELGFPLAGLEGSLHSGQALACVSHDLRKAAEQGISMSPTLVFNEGRQVLKGNVSYRVIEANVSELLSESHGGLGSKTASSRTLPVPAAT